MFDETLKYINAPFNIPDDYIVLASRERFLYKVENIKLVYSLLQKMSFTEGIKSELELSYWLMKLNDHELVEDLQRINKRLPLGDNKSGILSLFDRMIYQSKGLMAERITFLADYYKKGQYLNNK